MSFNLCIVTRGCSHHGRHARAAGALHRRSTDAYHLQLYLRFWPRGAERREEILGPLWCLRADFGRRGAPPSGFWAARSGARWILGTSCHGEGWWWSINQLEADAWLVGARRLQAACMEPGRRSGSSSGSQSEGPAPAGASSRRPAKETKARLRVGCWPCWRLCWLLAAQGCC